MLGEHAIVLGASVAGLLAARTLAGFYAAVTIVERDDLPEGARARKGVPQGRHTHGLLMRGAQALDELLPGLLAELAAAGAVAFDGSDLSRLYFCMNGHLAVRSGTAPGLQVLNMTRPFLECHIRRRVSALPNVAFLSGHDVTGLCMSDCGTVDGVRVVSRTAGTESGISADLVVDATGRGSRTPFWLRQLGFDGPTEDRVDIDLVYISQLLRSPPDGMWETGLIVSPVPGRPTGAAMTQCENGTVFLTGFGMCGHHPPRQLDGLYRFIDGIMPPHVMAALRSADPIGPVAQHHFPSSRWRRYDRMRRLPEGLLVVGDAICSFNPIYGQGMTVAALQALILRECLTRGAKKLPRRFFRMSAKPIGRAWELAVGGDLTLPEVRGAPPVLARLLNGYVDRLLRVAEEDTEALAQFIRVAWLVDPSVKLLRPNMIRRVVTARARGRTVPSAVMLGDELPDGVGGVQRG
ncbi:NAD(P)/FAD-dependent oxidoreductase [Mycobacterium vicinigordonae]|uniref:2-polyprenyl-6-methoxyphenol hydroxylase-like oxidoreductase n=1 Tax=Mycobacterium vicinigordonae TaxID=1719132 RepID=A0A7D6E2Y9_9MYCO|nr:2-polyprenyl-6-methoxyphenol hydroxylase-like oxidoreductase [Mycobacterium vicinigordonae]QLL07666.1 2-polyprenyl-6-methoxyphenol hydroxylase-like oxidoreductase [Mycobacterium vicinigordonae]